MTRSATDESDRDEELGDRLRRERPVPAAGFRGELHRRLTARAAHRRPTALWARVSACALTGMLLLLVGGLGVLGTGPFAV
jgi:hypothetical protein